MLVLQLVGFRASSLSMDYAFRLVVVCSLFFLSDILSLSYRSTLFNVVILAERSNSIDKGQSSNIHARQAHAS
jgi:hypothetical protein